MSEGEHLARALRGLFQDPANGWFPAFTDAVEGLTAAQASWRPDPEMHGVWEPVNHVRFWHEVALRQVSGQPVDRKALGAEDGWPPAGDPGDENAWRGAVERAGLANADLAEVMEGLTDETLETPLKAGGAAPWQLVHGLIAHTAYHTAQIVTVRRLQGLWIVDWRERAAARRKAGS